MAWWQNDLQGRRDSQEVSAVPQNIASYPPLPKLRRLLSKPVRNKEKAALIQAEFDAVLLQSSSRSSSESVSRDFFCNTSVAVLGDADATSHGFKALNTNPPKGSVLGKEQPCKTVSYARNACACPSMKPRSFESYDLFLAGSVKQSEEYKKYLQKRESKAVIKKGEHDTSGILSDEDFSHGENKLLASDELVGDRATTAVVGNGTYSSNGCLLPSNVPDIALGHASNLSSSAFKVAPFEDQHRIYTQPNAAKSDMKINDSEDCGLGCNDIQRREEDRLHRHRINDKQSFVNPLRDAKDSGCYSDIGVGRTESLEVFLNRFVNDEPRVEKDLVVLDFDVECDKRMEMSSMTERMKRMTIKSSGLPMTRKIAWECDLETSDLVGKCSIK